MPNCDFYAAGDDVGRIVEFVLRETSCRVFELSSAPGRRLQEFTSVAALAAVRKPRQTWPPLLTLWPMSANETLRIRRTTFALKGQRRSWREELEGWGLIQLYFSSVQGRSLSPSHTNHNTAARAAKWYPTYPELGKPSAWDFAAVTRESSRINRFIRSLAVDRLGSRIVLPGAAALFEVGVEASLN